MAECDMGTCHETAIVHLMGVSGRSFRSARACADHAQLLADYCAKPVERWHEDYELIARWDHETRQWVPIAEAADA